MSQDLISFQTHLNRASQYPLPTPDSTASVEVAWQFPGSPLEGAHIFQFPKKAPTWVVPLRFGNDCLLFPLWIQHGASVVSSQVLIPLTHLYPMQWLLLCHNKECFCSQNHNNFVCFQRLSFWHFRRNKIQVWRWKESIDFFSQKSCLSFRVP